MDRLALAGQAFYARKMADMRRSETSSTITPALLEFNAHGIPQSSTYGDVYHSADGGLEQARHVFITGNRLLERWRERRNFTILETGFGLGLNFLATWQAWRNAPQRCERLHFVSVEKHPFHAEDLATLHARWGELAAFSAELRAAWPPLTPGAHRLLLDGGRVTLTVFFGDALKVLPRIAVRADALYLDGFAPAKNPELWSPNLIRRITRLCLPDATLATWSVAADVRSALAHASWQLEKHPGFGRKRDMLCGQLAGSATASAAPRQALVIGAGIAGCTVAERLAARGVSVQIIEQHAAPALEASGNPAGLLHPVLSKDDNFTSRIARACHLYAVNLLRNLRREGQEVQFDLCGILQLARDEAQEADQKQTLESLGFPEDYARYVDRDTASTLAGQPVPQGGWYYPDSGWLSPPTFCRALLARWPDKIACRHDMRIAALRHDGNDWLAIDDHGHVIARAPLVVLTNAADATRLMPTGELPMDRIRGQVSVTPAGTLPPLKMALCGNGYVTPATGGTHGGVHCFGATFDFRDDDPEPRADGHLTNLGHLRALLPHFDSTHIDVAQLGGRVGFRTVTPDRLPLAGAVADAGDPMSNAPSSLRREATTTEVPRQPGLYCLAGLGSRGMLWAPLIAELVAARIFGEPLPLERELVDALDPARFLLRQRRRGSSNTATTTDNTSATG